MTDAEMNAAMVAEGHALRNWSRVAPALASEIRDMGQRIEALEAALRAADDRLREHGDTPQHRERGHIHRLLGGPPPPTDGASAADQSKTEGK